MFGLFRKKVTSVIKNISKKIIKEERKPEEKIEKKGSLKDGLKGQLKYGLSRIPKKITEKKLSESFLDETLEELELVLLENNLAFDVSHKIISEIKEKLKDKSVKRSKAKEIIEKILKDNIKDILDQPKISIEKIIKKNKPTLILFFGFNGSGKTTSMAKMASWLMNKKYSVVFSAADTYREASIEQLEVHARKLKVNVIKHKYGSDPAAVVFDAIKHAKSKGIDVVLADTAGRVHTDKNLIEELKKIVKVNKPHLNLLVCEAIAGNDVVEQAKIFNEAGVDGIILTKWDVDEKGGASLSLCHTLKKPIVFVGTGQEYKDLEKFDVNKVMKNVV